MSLVIMIDLENLVKMALSKQRPGGMLEYAQAKIDRTPACTDIYTKLITSVIKFPSTNKYLLFNIVSYTKSNIGSSSFVNTTIENLRDNFKVQFVSEVVNM